MAVALKKFNPDELPPPRGLPNFGATCYLNSLMQSLVACTPLVSTLRHYAAAEHYAKNPLAVALLNFFNSYEQGAGVELAIRNVYHALLTISRGRKDAVKFDSGQQDANEGLVLMLDLFDDYLSECALLFKHRTCTTTICVNCQHKSQKVAINMCFDVQADLKSEQHESFALIDENYGKSIPIGDFLYRQNTYNDGFTCPKCSSKDTKYQTVVLTMVPEILPIVLKKYSKKINTPFPEQLTFKSRTNTTLTYTLVSQCEHSGTMSGGHYWAISKRRVGDSVSDYVLNDSSAGPGELGPTPNSYLLFYVFTGET